MRDWIVWLDLRDAIRTLRRQPAFAAAAIGMLALGIGATIAMFTVVKRVLVDPLPYPGADRLVRIVHTIGGIRQSYFGDPIVLTYAANAQAFESFGAWVPTAAGVTITGQGEPEEVRALTASRGFYATLGVHPDVGRWFTSEEDVPGAPATAMLGAAYWRQRHGGDRGVVGQTLVINGTPHLIVGVMPARVAFGAEFDVLLPLRINPARPVPFFRLNGIARMRPGATLEEANADVARMLEIYFDTFRVNTDRAVTWAPSLVPLDEDVIGDVGATLWVLMSTIGLVLLMACANVANLLLVGAESRGRELAVRAALGAGRVRLARAMAIDSLVLAGAGSLLGLAAAWAGLRLLVAAEPSALPRVAEIALDPAAFVFAMGLTLVCAVLFSVLPIARCLGPRFTAMAGLGLRGASVSPDRQRSQHALVAGQLALALVLLVGAGLMVRSARALRDVEPGFAAPQTLQTFGITIQQSLVPDLDRVMRTQQAILDRIAAIPGVRSAAFTTRLPLDPSDRWSAALAIEDRPHAGGAAPPNHQVKIVSPGSFHTFGTRLVAGRDFTWTDLSELREVAIVSENLARETWGSAEAALGRRIRQFYGPSSAPWREIVGVSADVHDDGVHRSPPATVYWPARLDAKVFMGYQPRRVSVAIRTDRAGTTGLIAELRDAVRAVDPSLPFSHPMTLDTLYTRSMSRTSFTLVLLAVAGGMALLLGVCGLFGVVAFAVAQRRREIGIRLALGARRHDVYGLFLRRGSIVAAAGLLIGLGAAAGATRAMDSVLFGVTPLDPLTFTVMPIGLLAATLLATYVPARRALAVDPVETMRAE
jgi:predicted permease